MNCEICNNKVSKVLINLGSQPIPDNLSKNLKTSLNKKKFNTKIVYCEKCITAYQYLTIKKQKLFTANYSYRARNTKDVVNGLKALSEEIKKKIQNKKKIKILDIGCNDGTLLDFFSSKSYETFGIEPTNAYKDCDKRHTVLNKFFDKTTAKYFLKNYGSPDIIVFTNVFAHIEKFKLLIENLKYLKKKETILVIENHNLISVLKKFQFDTFYHEHLRTYSLNSFFYISKLLNMKITKFSFPKRYGGNIRIFYESKNFEKKNVLQNISEEKKAFYYLKKKFIKNLKKWKKNKLKAILDLNKKYGSLPAKSYPARASVIINYLRLNSKHISNIFEQDHSKKINKFVPGTDIKIIGDKYLKNKILNKPILNFSWHISKEINYYLKKSGINNKIIDIINEKDIK